METSRDIPAGQSAANRTRRPSDRSGAAEINSDNHSTVARRQRVESAPQPLVDSQQQVAGLAADAFVSVVKPE